MTRIGGIFRPDVACYVQSEGENLRKSKASHALGTVITLDFAAAVRVNSLAESLDIWLQEFRPSACWEQVKRTAHAASMPRQRLFFKRHGESRKEKRQARWVLLRRGPSESRYCPTTRKNPLSSLIEIKAFVPFVTEPTLCHETLVSEVVF